MGSTLVLEPASGQRGVADHTVRKQIISAAAEHFAHYGYGKTTVSDLAKSIGFSKAYIYRFFGSKQAIGEVICFQTLTNISEAVREAINAGQSPHDKIRLFFRTLVEASMALLFNERRLYDMAATSVLERWPSHQRNIDIYLEILNGIIREGRESGDFERKTPLDETCRAILQCMQPFINPLMLEHNIDLVPDGPNEIANLVLRSLSP